MSIQYFANRKITAEQAIELYRKTSLGERRPIDSPETFEQMLKHANLIVTAWDENRLVGISRTLTDFVYVAYLLRPCRRRKLPETGNRKAAHQRDPGQYRSQMQNRLDRRTEGH